MLGRKGTTKNGEGEQRSRLVTIRLLARLARARNVGQILDEEGEVFADGRSNHSQKLCAVIFGFCVDIDQKRVPRKDEICKKAAVFREG